MTTLFMVKAGNALVPSSPLAQELFDKMKPGVEYKVEATQPRKGKFHKWFWVFVNRVAENIDGWTPRRLKGVLCYATGWADTFIWRGEKMTIPASIAFHAMDQTEFEGFVDDCIRYTCEEIAPHLDPAEWSNVEEVLTR